MDGNPKTNVGYRHDCTESARLETRGHITRSFSEARWVPVAGIERVDDGRWGY